MKKAAAYAAASFAIAFTTILAIQLQYPIMYGIDGPYYLIQLRHLLSEGAIKYPDPPLTYYMLAPFYALSAIKDLGLKVAVAFYAGLTALTLFEAFKKYGNLSGFSAALAFTFSPYTLRLSYDLIKNFVSLFFIALILYIFINVRNQRKAVIYASIVAAASALSHVLTFGVLALYSIMLSAIYLFEKRRRDAAVKAAAAAAITSILILAATLTIVPQIVGYDSEKLLSFIENPFNQGKARMTALGFSANILIGSAGIAYGLTKRKSPEIAAAAGIMLILVNLPFIGEAWLFRFSLMSSILMPPIAALIVGEIGKTERGLAVVLLTGLMLSAFAPAASAIKITLTMRDYKMLKDELVKKVPEGSMLVVPDVRLRYWLEALHEDEYNIVKQMPHPPPPGTYLILDKARGFKINPRWERVLDGDRVEVLRIR